MVLTKWLVYITMPLIFKPTIVKEHHYTETQRGEITVNINLTLTLQVDQNGAISVSASPTVVQKPEPQRDYCVQMPDLDIEETQLIGFGKEVKNTVLFP